MLKRARLLMFHGIKSTKMCLGSIHALALARVVILDTELPEVKIFTPTQFADARGGFFEVLRDEWLQLLPGAAPFVHGAG